MSDEEPLDEKRLWEQWGFESLEELGQFHKYEMARRRATRPIPTDEEAEHQHAEQPPKKAEGAAEPKNTERAVDPKKARKINDPDSKKDDEFGKNEETSKGLDAGGNIDSATNE